VPTREVNLMFYVYPATRNLLRSLLAG